MQKRILVPLFVIVGALVLYLAPGPTASAAGKGRHTPKPSRTIAATYTETATATVTRVFTATVTPTMTILATRSVTPTATPGGGIGAQSWKGSGTVVGGDFFASPSATNGSGDGSLGNPWSIRDAVQAAHTAARSKTIWMRGGTYPSPKGDGSGLFSYFVVLDGNSSGTPITMRSYPGEWAKVDAGNTDSGDGGVGQPPFILQGNNYIFREFEIYSSECANNRTSGVPGPAPTLIHYGMAMNVEQTVNHDGIRLINMVIHDTAQGCNWWEQATNSEMHGCVIYYNGWDASDDGHGHGVYADNFATPGGTKTHKNNIIFRNFGVNFHSYNEQGQVTVNFDLNGNLWFSSGLSVAFPGQRNFIIGSSNDPTGDSSNNIRNNGLYENQSPPPPGSDFQLGFGTHVYNDPTVTGNYMPEIGVNWIAGGSSAGITGNTLTHTEGDQFDVAGNTFLGEPLTGTHVMIRINDYETGRASIGIWNWDGNSSVNVDLSSVLSNGDPFSIWYVFNLFGAPVVSGNYGGGSVAVPMTGLTRVGPIGYTAPATELPTFGAFVVRKG